MKSRMRESVEFSIKDALDRAGALAYNVDDKTRPLTRSKEGIKGAFDAARMAVAGMASDNIDEDAFGVALEAAMDALDGSTIRRYRDAINEEMQDLVTAATELAARKGAMDRILETARRRPEQDPAVNVAVRAAGARLNQPDAAETVQAAKKVCRVISETISHMVVSTIQNAIPPNAAAAAVFEAAIRDVPRRNMADAIANICQRMPKMAGEYGPFNEQFTAAIVMVILDKTRGCATYKVAAKVVDKYVVKEANEQIDDFVIQMVRGAAYTAMVAGAYDTAVKKRTFESGHERALALACNVNPDRHDESVPDGFESNPAMAKAAKEMMSRMSATFNTIMSNEDPEDVNLFEELRGTQYKTAASDEKMSGFLSLYRMAYAAGYDSIQQ